MHLELGVERRIEVIPDSVLKNGKKNVSHNSLSICVAHLNASKLNWR